MEISGAVPPPSGVKPNFEHPESIGYRIIIGAVVCWWSATVVLFLRLYTRRNVTHIIAIEDYILFVGWYQLKLSGVKHGAGIHFWDLPTTTLNSFIRGRLHLKDSNLVGYCRIRILWRLYSLH
ncbi:hypothetical protein L207DRAFT_572478 [Hyaloscypha variabilis F]|uniref:Uncharacterized protein n=1 Tax=Hyaloscypha variabilis (strain UAMH 11265 / GT02V1 / F) TaxID=1149755 RepID=A0A2J6QZG2_HYAVF|nr:hypothetical protein L207DRAFT_572478 [Hyaloscypha variabilis F]